VKRGDPWTGQAPKSETPGSVVNYVKMCEMLKSVDFGINIV